MAGVKHTKVLVTPDSGAEDKVYGEDWNGEHSLSDVAAQTSLDAVSNAVSVVSQALSVETAARVAKDDSLSGAISVISNALSVLSNTNSAEHAALSVRIDNAGGGGSVTSNEVSAVSAQAASAIAAETSNRISADNALSNSISALSAALSERASVLSQAISVVSNAVSVLSQANSVQHAALSNAISATSAALSERASALSQAISVVSNAVSVLSQTNSVDHAALSSRITSVANAGGAGSASPNAWVSVANGISATALTNISGMSISVSAGGLYEFVAQLGINRSGVSAVPRIGMTFPGMKEARGDARLQMSAPAGSVGITAQGLHVCWDGGASGSVLLSMALSNTKLSIHADFGGYFFVSTTGVVQIQAACSATAQHITITPGSYMRVKKIN